MQNIPTPIQTAAKEVYDMLLRRQAFEAMQLADEVTADAMHFQRETCRKGIQRKGNGQIPDCREERGMSPQGNGCGFFGR